MSFCSLPRCIQTARVMGWREKEIPLLHPSMTSLPMAISQEMQQPPSAAYLSTLYTSLKTDTGQAGCDEPCSILEFQQETLQKHHHRNYNDVCGKKLSISKLADESQRRVLNHQHREWVQKSTILQQITTGVYSVKANKPSFLKNGAFRVLHNVLWICNIYKHKKEWSILHWQW